MKQLSTRLSLSDMQTKWSATLNPLLALPIAAGIQLTGIVMMTDVPNAINHLLQRKPQGWIITDVTGNCAIFRSQPFNDTTLTLIANNDVTINLWVY